MPLQLRNYYQVLGVPFGASAEEIKRRYRELAKQYHPDVNPSPDAAQRMQELNEAYRVLTDPRLRLAYHMRLAAYAMRQRKHASYAPPKPVSAPRGLRSPAYLGWMLGGLVGLVVLSATAYHWLNPFVVQRATLAGYGWTQWPAYLHLPLTVEVLNLSYNNFTAWPAGLENLPALRVLDLSHNRLTYLPASIVQYPQLEELNLAGNQITALPLGLGELRRLKRLNLRDNALRTLPVEVFLLPALVELDLRGNPLSPEMRESLAYWRQERPDLRLLW